FLFLLLPGTILYVQSIFKEKFKKDKVFNIIFYLSLLLVFSAAFFPTKLYTMSFLNFSLNMDWTYRIVPGKSRNKNSISPLTENS
ncbi:hypothetical protein EHO65_01850, partial [Leptospira andrefontaineae]